jgi:Protein of unknown function (DUF2585)
MLYTYHMSRFATCLGTVGVLTGTIYILHAADRLWISASGQILWWVSDVQSAEASQQIADWYSASHFIHGILFFAILYFFRRYLSMGTRFLLAVGIEAGWEILENSPIIIDRYREATIAIGYTGDSILNSVADIVFMMLGFIFARYVPVWVAVAVVVFLELFVAYLIHDNLFLNILMLLYPIDAVRVWQGNV